MHDRYANAFPAESSPPEPSGRQPAGSGISKKPFGGDPAIPSISAAIFW
jgi:hypothetical protein